MKTMALKLVHTKTMSRNEWLSFRSSGIGGSDVGSILGISKYKQPLQVYMEKTGQWEIEDLSEVEAIKWGNILEPIVADEFASQNPQYKVQKCNYMLQHPEHTFMLANIDRELYHPEKGWGILEIKTANARMDKVWTEDEIPYEYILQIQHYLAVTGLNWGYVAVLIGGQKYKQYYVERDQELIDILIDKEGYFWNNHVLASDPPMPDFQMDCKDIFDRLYPSEAIANVELNLSEECADILLYINILEDTAKEKKRLEDLEQMYQNIIKDKMKHHEIANFNGGSISWKYTKPGFSVDGNLLKEQFPEVYEQVKKERKPVRMFRISKK